jgi:hypothetical protein
MVQPIFGFEKRPSISGLRGEALAKKGVLKEGSHAIRRGQRDVLLGSVIRLHPMPGWVDTPSDCMMSRASAFAETFRSRHSPASGSYQWT